MDATNLNEHISEDILSRFENGSDLDRIISGEIFQQDNLYMEEENELDDIIILHMDIREPLSSLKSLLEQKTGVELKKYSFWLQDAQILEPHKNLVDQCVKGEGLVQINVQIKTTNQHINIVDVLKPTDAALASLGNQANLPGKSNKTHPKVESDSYDDATNDGQETTTNQKQKPCLNWALDTKFKKEQTRLKIPDDPNDWTVPHVKHWLQWAVREFNLTDISRADWNITGEQLCSLSHEEFRKKVPNDQGNTFWTHLQLLKECKFVSVVVSVLPKQDKEEFSDSNSSPIHREQKIMRKTPANKDNNKNLCVVNGQGGSGNNGQMQLWQFLLEILTDCEHTGIIQWVGTEGEFKLIDPERVARLWGVKKNKPAMNYEKLSRALRYYYDGDMISKVSGKRFAYKFDCDLKLLIGYDAEQLSMRVNEKKYVDEYLTTNEKPDEAPSEEDEDDDDDE